MKPSYSPGSNPRPREHKRMQTLASAARALRALPLDERHGEVVTVRGALIEIDGLAGATEIGSRLRIRTRDGIIDAEVTGIDGTLVQCLPFSDPHGLASGS